MNRLADLQGGDLNQPGDDFERRLRNARMAAFFTEAKRLGWKKYLLLALVFMIGGVVVLAIVSPRTPRACLVSNGTVVSDGWTIASKGGASRRYLTVKLDNGATVQASASEIDDRSKPIRVSVETCLSKTAALAFNNSRVVETLDKPSP